MLTESERGHLETVIDSALKTIPPSIRIYRDPNIKGKLQLTNAEDYILGQMVGYVLGAMTQYYTNVEKKFPSKEDLDEINNILVIRMTEFRIAIFQQG